MKRIPSLYRKPFSLLAQQLLYVETPSNDIGFNVAKISREIQRQFILLHQKSQETFLKKFAPIEPFSLQICSSDGAVIEEIKFESIPEERLAYSLKENHIRLMPNHKFVEWLSNLVAGCAPQYLHWGFTPKLAYSDSEQKIKPNCFGTTILLGSHFRKRGIRVDMGVTPDHPVVIFYLKNGVYATDNSGKVVKLNGKFKKYSNYKVYYPTSEDLEMFKMIIVYPFDDAVVYEILENVEALRRMSLGEHHITLPNSYIESLEVSQKNESVLQMTNWKNLQQILFPEIHKAFLTHQKEWLEEVDRMRKLRGSHYGQHVWKEISEEAIKLTTYADMEYKEGQLALLEEAGPYTSDICHYLFLDFDFVFPETVPDNTKKFFSAVKAEMISRKGEDKYFSEILGIVMRILENMTFNKFAKKQSSVITN